MLDEDGKGGGIRGRLSQSRRSQFFKEGKYQNPDLKNTASEGQKCKCGLPELEHTLGTRWDMAEKEIKNSPEGCQGR